MDKNTTNAVRQVMMNELGLTRESVREEVKSIVTDAVDKAINIIINDGTLSGMILSKLSFGRTQQDLVERIERDAKNNLREKVTTAMKDIEIEVKFKS